MTAARVEVPARTLPDLTAAGPRQQLRCGLDEAIAGADLVPLPQCPQGHGQMVLRPLEGQTKEQRWCGVWYDCPPGPVGDTCTSSVLFYSPELEQQLAEQAQRQQLQQLSLFPDPAASARAASNS